MAQIDWPPLLSTILLAVFWGMTWWAAWTAYQDGEVYGNTPASWNWILGQLLLGVGISIVFVPMIWRLLYGELIDAAIRQWIGVAVLAVSVLAKWYTRRGFAIHRDAARIRRLGPPEEYNEEGTQGYSESESASEKEEGVA